MINEPLVEPLSLADDTFFFESESIWNRLALFVVNGNPDINPVQDKFGKRMFDQRPHRARHNPSSRLRLSKPVPGVGNSIILVDGVVPDNPDNRTLKLN